MKKSFVAAGAAIAVSALVAFGTVSPASATPTVVAPISTVGASDDRATNAAVSNDGSLVAGIVQYAGVTIYTVATGAKRDIPIATLGSNQIMGGAFSPDNSFLYVTDRNNGEVIVIDLSDDSVDRRINVSVDPSLVEASQDGNFLYVHDYFGDLQQVDLSNSDALSSVLPLTTPYAPYSACLSNDGATLYIPSFLTDIFVVDTATMTLSTTWPSGVGSAKLYGCEFDGDGNLVIADYNTSAVMKFDSSNGSVLGASSVLLNNVNVYFAVPSCDTIYIPATNTQATVATLNLETLGEGDTINPAETSGGSGFYGGNGSDRSLDGSVVALGGYSSSDGLVLVLSPECDTTPESGGGESAPQLANTGIDSSASGISLAVAGGMLIAGAIALVAIRRRNA
jgi:LPXTG-motif cell wall-anchored protein